MSKYFQYVSVKKLLILSLIVVLVAGLSRVVVVPGNESFESYNLSKFGNIIDCLEVDFNKNDCYDQFIDEYGEDLEVLELLSQMEESRLVDPQIELECHPIAHAIGRYSLRRYSEIGDAFRACDFSCYSGCYHGVMERLFFSENEILEGQNHLALSDLETRMPGICDEANFEDPSPVEIFQCLHGAGHASLYSLNYNLENALKACDFLDTEYEQSSCYGGVFMENITSFDPDGRDVSEDPLYPCNKIEDKYKADCYLLQTSRMLELGVDYSGIAELCAKTGIYGTTTCFMSLGRDLSVLIKSNEYDRVANICEGIEGDEEFTLNCIDGVSFLLLDDPNGFSNSFRFCNSLNGLVHMRECYRRLVPYAGSLYGHDAEFLESQCEKHSGDNIEYCFQGVEEFTSYY